MPLLTDYTAFTGRHWETGTIHNVLAYQGLTAPHTRQPFSEALLLGISGGITAMYFVFEYKGFEPQVTINTRYPFEAMQHIWERLALAPNIQQTSSATQAVTMLTSALEARHPAIVWVDICSLPYDTNMPFDENFWLMMPLVIYGYDDTLDRVWLADRAAVPFHITTGELAAARNRTQKNRHRLVTLEPAAPPTAEQVAQAVRLGIDDCVRLFLEPAPKGPPDNFGLRALHKWAEMLTSTRSTRSWARVFPPGAALYAGLTAAYSSIESGETGGSASRNLYADFLEEARTLLENPVLAEGAALFRQSAHQWSDLAAAMLPDHVAPLHETRTLMQQKDRLFREQGAAARAEIGQIEARLEQIKAEVAAAFPLSEQDVGMLREELRERVLAIAATEAQAFRMLGESG